MEETYTHGHQESVLRSHRWRTVANSAAYMAQELRPGMDLLDVGCGPGNLTVDLARLVRPGRVVGVDRASEIVEEARREAGDGDVEFATGDVYALDFPDNRFDVVHAHQVLQHLRDPVAALTEMRRVLRPGGLLAVRDSDYAAFVWAPADERLDRWRSLYRYVCHHNGADPDAGRSLGSWVRRAGFTDLRLSTSTWTFASGADLDWWAGVWADRCTGSGFAEQARAYGLTTRGEQEVVAEGWREWAAGPDAVFVAVHFEVTARRPGQLPQGR